METPQLRYLFALALRQITRHWWLPLPPREKLARLFFRPHHVPDTPFLIHLDDIRYRGTLREYLDWRIFFLGSFERETLNLARHLARDLSQRGSEGGFLDVGANKGLYTLLLASHFPRVVAVEPMEENRAKLERALRENDIDNVHIAPCGLSDEEGSAPFYLPPAGNEGIGSFVSEHLPQAEQSITLPIRRGDDLCAEHRLTLGLVKIDTEGHEAAVLEGLRATLDRDRPFIILEIGDSTKAPLEARGGLTRLLPEGYTLFEISEHTRQRHFSLRALRDEELLSRDISNNLACPRERLSAVAPFLRT